MVSLVFMGRLHMPRFARSVAALAAAALLSLAPAAPAVVLVTGFESDNVLRYSDSGAFIDALAPAGSGGLNGPRGIAVGPDGNTYVASSLTNDVLRYDTA